MQESYNVIVEKDVYVPMRDGVRLAVDIYRPDAPGKFPALLAMSAYGKNTQRQMLPQPVPSPLGDACIEAGMTNEIVARGYVHVIACSRGTGQSEGEYLSMYSKQEAEDGYDLVEWIAAQPWCDGNVGMIGISYFGTIQLVVASERPPHLKAIAPFEATTDQYLACYHGGVLDGFYSELFTGRHSTLSWSGFQPKNVKSKMMKTLPPDELKRRVEELKNDPDINQYNLLYSILDCPEKNPIFFDIMLNPYDDNGEYWWNPNLENIEIPVLCGNAWFPDCGPKFVRGPFMIWQGVKGPKKMFMVPPGWLERPFSQYHDIILDWFDYWLKGIDNGIMDEPPIKLFISGDNEYRYEYEWPLKRTQWTDFYLRTHGRLSTEPEKFDYIEPDGFTQPPLSVTQKINSVEYSTGPLNKDLEITGPITLYLQMAIDAEDSMIKASIFDVDPTGKETEMTHGHLKLSHRELDPVRTKPWQPFHKHTKESVKPVVPGEIYEYAIELYPMGHVFKKGHQLKLKICSLDLPGAAFSYHVGSSKTISYKIYRDRMRPSRLFLPVIPR